MIELVTKGQLKLESRVGWISGVQLRCGYNLGPIDLRHDILNPAGDWLDQINLADEIDKHGGDNEGAKQCPKRMKNPGAKLAESVLVGITKVLDFFLNLLKLGKNLVVINHDLRLS